MDREKNSTDRFISTNLCLCGHSKAAHGGHRLIDEKGPCAMCGCMQYVSAGEYATVN